MQDVVALTARMAAVLSIDPAAAGLALGALLTALLAWLGHWVSHSNARISTALQAAEKAAVVDVRDMALLSPTSGALTLTFGLRNFGATPAREVLVRIDGRAVAYVPVVAPDDRPVFAVELAASADISDMLVDVAFRDHVGRLARSTRGIGFASPGAVATQFRRKRRLLS